MIRQWYYKRVINDNLHLYVYLISQPKGSEFIMITKNCNSFWTRLIFPITLIKDVLDKQY